LLFQPAECTTLSHELWEYNRIVIGLTFALLLANTGSFIYSLCSSLPGTESPEHISSDAAISRGRWAGDICQIDHLVDTRASILSTFTADLILLALKLVGILRWKEARQKVGTWRLLYSEVSLSTLPSSRGGHFERTTLTQYWP
jgi:hypothetical protein